MSSTSVIKPSAGAWSSGTVLRNVWPELLLCSLLAFFWMWQLQVLPAWYDEAITLLQLAGAPLPVWPEGLRPVSDHHAAVFDGRMTLSDIGPMLRETDVHPPLYYWAARLWADVAGQGLTGMRSLSLVAVLVAMAALATVAGGWGASGRRLALLAFAVAPMSTWAAISARDYGLALCMITLAMLAATRALDPERARPLAVIAFGAAAGLAFLSHYFTLFTIAPAGAVLLLARGRQMPMATLLGVALFAGAVLLGWGFLQAQLDSRPEQMGGFEGMVSELTTLVRLLLTLVLENQPSGLVRPISFALSAALLAAVGLAALLQSRTDPRVLLNLAAFAGYWLGLLVLFWLTDKSIAKGAAARYAIFALPSFCLLLAAATAYFQVRFWRAAPALFAAMLVGLAGISWFDGRLALYPWNNADQIAAIEAGLAGTKPEAVTALVPRGYGRGGPGRFALALDPAMQMAVLDPERDLPLLQASGPDRGLLAGARAVFLAEDETGALSGEFARIAAELAMAGYLDRGEGVWQVP